MSCLGLIILLAGCRKQPIGLAAVSVPALDSQATSSDAGLTLDSSGGVLLSWIGGDTNDLALYVARSADHGVTWSAATRVAGGAAAPGEVHPHGESSPRVVAGPGENVAITWANSVPAPSRKWPAAMMRFSRSGDGGKSWSAPVT
ncbi:MAG: sialidase family protein, partial [Gemmatimonadales bacterium]